MLVEKAGPATPQAPAPGLQLDAIGTPPRLKEKRRRLIPTVDGLDQPQGAVGVSRVVLTHPDTKSVLCGGAVIVEELQALVASLGVQQSALQLGHRPRAGRAGGEVHEIPRACVTTVR